VNNDDKQERKTLEQLLMEIKQEKDRHDNRLREIASQEKVMKFFIFIMLMLSFIVSFLVGRI